MPTPHLCVFTGFILHLAVAIWNGFFGPSIGADKDALSFHFLAVEIAQDISFTNFQITWIYPQLLGIFYLLTTDSLFLGSLLSCFVWTLSAYVLVGSMNLLSINRVDQVKALVVYALLPSAILFTAVTLREPYQLLFINLQIYAALRIFFRSTILNWAMLIFACIGAGFLHGGLLLHAVFFLITFIFFKSTKQFKSFFKVNLLISAPIIFFVMLSILLESGDVTTYKIDGGIGEAIQSFNERAYSLDARTNYKSGIVINDILDIGFFVITSVIQYLFEPFFWNIQNFYDFALALEGILRGYLIYKAYRALRISTNLDRRLLFLIFFSYLTLTCLFALGTVNWGTATRHNVPALGLLLLASLGCSRGSGYLNKSPPKYYPKNLA